MNGTPHIPEELGAHAFGLLDAAQSRAVEEHLAICRVCRREWEELRGMVDLLDEVPPEAFLEGPPDGELVLRRTLRQVRSEAAARVRRRRYALVAAAAVAVAAVMGGGVLIGRTTAPPPAVTAAPAPAPAPTPAADAVVLSGGGAGGISMTATLTPAEGWVRLTTSVRGLPAGERCRIVVEAEDGTREIAGSWLVPPGGWREGVTLDGSALVPLDDVAAVVVENEAGRRFAIART
jgi:predicted anti-sigma-YlaC factor YlaD